MAESQTPTFTRLMAVRNRACCTIEQKKMPQSWSQQRKPVCNFPFQRDLEITLCRKLGEEINLRAFLSLEMHSSGESDGTWAHPNRHMSMQWWALDTCLACFASPQTPEFSRYTPKTTLENWSLPYISSPRCLWEQGVLWQEFGRGFASA